MRTMRRSSTDAVMHGTLSCGYPRSPHPLPIAPMHTSKYRAVGMTRHGADSGGPDKPHMHQDKSSRGVGIALSASCLGLTRASVASGILDNFAQCTLMEILGLSPRMTMESEIRRPE